MKTLVIWHNNNDGDSIGFSTEEINSDKEVDIIINKYLAVGIKIYDYKVFQEEQKYSSFFVYKQLL